MPIPVPIRSPSHAHPCVYQVRDLLATNPHKVLPNRVRLQLRARPVALVDPQADPTPRRRARRARSIKNTTRPQRVCRLTSPRTRTSGPAPMWAVAPMATVAAERTQTAEMTQVMGTRGVAQAPGVALAGGPALARETGLEAVDEEGGVANRWGTSRGRWICKATCPRGT